MVRATTAAVAVAVLAMTAATLARPVEFSDEVIARDGDYELDARDYAYDMEFDAREVEDYEAYARELLGELYDARDFEEIDYDARDYYDMEDFDARGEYDWEDIMERQEATTTSAPSSTITPAPTSTGVSTATNMGSNGKTTVTVITHAPRPTGCRKPNIIERVKRAWRRAKDRSKAKKNKKASSTSVSASSMITSSAAATSTYPPSVKDSTTKGPDGTRTVYRTVTPAKTPCPEVKKRAFTFDLDELD